MPPIHLTTRKNVDQLPPLPQLPSNDDESEAPKIKRENALQKVNEPDDPADNFPSSIRRFVDRYMEKEENHCNYCHAAARFVGKQKDGNWFVDRTQLYPIKKDFKPKTCQDKKWCLKVYLNYNEIKR